MAQIDSSKEEESTKERGRVASTTLMMVSWSLICFFFLGCGLMLCFGGLVGSRRLTIAPTHPPRLPVGYKSPSPDSFRLSVFTTFSSGFNACIFCEVCLAEIESIVVKGCHKEELNPSKYSSFFLVIVDYITSSWNGFVCFQNKAKNITDRIGVGKKNPSQEENESWILDLGKEKK